MNPTRRATLTGAVSLLALAACSTSTGLTQAQITQATVFLAGAQSAYNIVKATYPLAVAPIDPQVQIAFAKARSFLAGLSTALPALTNGTNLTAIVNNVLEVANLVSSVLPPGVVPPEIMLGFQAVEALAPVLLALAQSLAPSATAKAVLTPVPPRFASSMSPAAAQDTLRALASVR